VFLRHDEIAMLTHHLVYVLANSDHFTDAFPFLAISH
jgi:hypothetical protein